MIWEISILCKSRVPHQPFIIQVIIIESNLLNNSNNVKPFKDGRDAILFFMYKNRFRGIREWEIITT